METTSADETIFLLRDEEGNRLGRVGTRRYSEQGWFVSFTEKCGGAE